MHTLSRLTCFPKPSWKTRSLYSLGFFWWYKVKQTPQKYIQINAAYVIENLLSFINLAKLFQFKSLNNLVCNCLKNRVIHWSQFIFIGRTSEKFVNMFSFTHKYKIMTFVDFVQIGALVFSVCPIYKHTHLPKLP